MSNSAEKISDAELEVLKVLWSNESPMSERQIVNVLIAQNNWHRATIQTLIRRLCEKNVIKKEKKDIFYFSPIVTETELAKERTVDLLNKVFGGNAINLISTLLGNDILSEDDMDALKKYWKERKSENE